MVLKKLWNLYESHKYKLKNSYVFAWESDFFSMTPSGYFYEIEVKVTKADFKADAKKVSKHRFLSAAYKKNSTALLKGRLEYEVEVPILEPKLDASLKRVRDEYGDVIMIPTGRLQTLKAYSNTGEILDKHRGLKVKMLNSSINIVKYKVPNRFFYAVPEGLITKDEVPEYAGLIYVTEKGAFQVKAAPVLHSQKLDLRQVLLDKFYYLSLHKWN